VSSRAEERSGSAIAKGIRVGALIGRAKVVRARVLPLKSWNAVKWHERRKAGWSTLRSTYAQMAQR